LDEQDRALDEQRAGDEACGGTDAPDTQAGQELKGA
jgi:hypothetical protein